MYMINCLLRTITISVCICKKLFYIAWIPLTEVLRYIDKTDCVFVFCMNIICINVYCNSQC